MSAPGAGSRPSSAQAAPSLHDRLDAGVMIPAHPLALDEAGRPDLRAQRALSRYQLAAGADGLAVGVHSTQFELHDDPVMLREIWELAADAVREHREVRNIRSTGRARTPSGPSTILVAGIVGDTRQAVREAAAASELGYEAALLSPWGMAKASQEALLERAAAVGEVMPTIGFYLQDSVGGLPLDRSFWGRLFDLDSVVAVKTAPFDRYRTNDVVQELLFHDRWDQVAVLTGNDDAIVHDLITPYRAVVDDRVREVRARGGLLGQWAVGARAAARLVTEANAAVEADCIPQDLLARAADMVEINAAVFDVVHDFAGCVPGVNEVLRQQGLVSTARCLGPDVLSPGQADLIRGVRERFPDLLDEEFVEEGRDGWLS